MRPLGHRCVLVLAPLLAPLLATASREAALLRAGEERWVTRSFSSLPCTTLYPRLCTRLTSLVAELPGLAAAARADTVERVASNNLQINIANILFLMSYPLYVCTVHGTSHCLRIELDILFGTGTLN